MKVNYNNKNIFNHHLNVNYFGKVFEKNKKSAIFIYKNYLKSLCNLLKIIGVNTNTIPVLDVLRKNTSKIIGSRSFSHNKEIVKTLGDITVRECQKHKIISVIKHIPGHGLARVDSHHFTPTINKNQKFLIKNDFATFKNKKTFFAMTAHVIFNKIDKANTVTHSKKMIKIIRNKIGFKNILISDDLSMKSLKGTLKDNTIKTFNSGCNLALHCNGNLKEMEIIAKNSPLINNFITKKTSQFYKILS